MGQDGQDGEHREGKPNRQSDEDIRDLLARAHALMCRCKYEEALPLSEQAVELAPQSREAWQDLGSNYGYLGRVTDLERAFEQALRLVVTPWDEVETWFSRGHAENNANAWQAALRSFQALAELEPDWRTPLLFQGMVLGNMGTFIDQRHHDEALVAFDRALTLGGLSIVDERTVYGLKAKSLYGLGRDEEAKVYDRRAKEMWRAEQAASPRPSVLH